MNKRIVSVGGAALMAEPRGLDPQRDAEIGEPMSTSVELDSLRREGPDRCSRRG